MTSFPQISCNKILLRAILQKKDWIKDDEVQWLAFFPAETDKGEGISVIFDKKDAHLFFKRPIYGYISVHVGHLRKTEGYNGNLDIIQDREKHALIMGIPYFFSEEDKEKRKAMKFNAQRICKEIVKTKAVRLNEFCLDGFVPETPSLSFFFTKPFLLFIFLLFLVLLVSLFYFLKF